MTLKLKRGVDRWSGVPDVNGDGFVIKVARYAKNKYAVHCAPDGSGLKTRVARLASAIGGNCYSNRERAYIMSAKKAERFHYYAVNGWDACVMTDRLEAPRLEAAE